MTRPVLFRCPTSLFAAVLMIALPACVSDVNAQNSTIPAETPPPYADLADLIVQSPLVVDATVRSTAQIKGPEAVSLAAGAMRYYVEAEVGTLIRGTNAIEPRIGYLVDVPTDARGKTRKLKGRRVLLFARSVSGSPAQVQLVTPSAQRLWTPATDALARRIAEESAAADAPPVVTDVGNAFHVAGSLPGEGETQIFLTTEGNRPASLSILRRPGEQPRWSVATSEVIDDSAAPPARDTLLWYRLACALPPALPDRSTASLAPGDAVIAKEDYGFVIAQLGPCRSVG